LQKILYIVSVFGTSIIVDTDILVTGNLTVLHSKFASYIKLNYFYIFSV